MRGEPRGEGLPLSVGGDAAGPQHRAAGCGQRRPWSPALLRGSEAVETNGTCKKSQWQISLGRDTECGLRQRGLRAGLLRKMHSDWGPHLWCPTAVRHRAGLPCPWFTPHLTCLSLILVPQDLQAHDPSDQEGRWALRGLLLGHTYLPAPSCLLIYMGLEIRPQDWGSEQML